MFYPFFQKVPPRAEPGWPRAVTSLPAPLCCLSPSLSSSACPGSPPSSTPVLIQALLWGESNPRPFWVDWGPRTVDGNAVCHFSCKAGKSQGTPIVSIPLLGHPGWFEMEERCLVHMEFIWARTLITVAAVRGIHQSGPLPPCHAAPALPLWGPTLGSTLRFPVLC